MLNLTFIFDMKYNEQIATETSQETEILDAHAAMFQLIVWNDDINTFDWVTQTLIEVCKHEKEQAEQCTMYIHFKGKYAVKEGDYDLLKSMCDGITDRGIGATIEETVV